MTNQSYSLFYPMLAMFLWTFLIMIKNVHVRVRAVARGQLTNQYFELFRGEDPDDDILKTGNHLRNLMEFPPLFYVIALVVMFSERSDSLYLYLAWAYVGARIGHSLVHLTINKVPIRFLFYGFSNIVLAVMWSRFGLSTL